MKPRPELTNDADAFHAFNDLLTAVGRDPEIAHTSADDFLVDVLVELGFLKLANAFQTARRDWWYA